jgi:Glycosyl hydrolases family 35
MFTIRRAIREHYKPIPISCYVRLIYVIQINAETTAGGLALWSTSETTGMLRTNATSWTDAWTPYIQAIGKVVALNQITNGGPIIAVQIGKPPCLT